MKLTSYKEALKMGEKAIADLMIPVKVRKAKKQAELEMCSLDEQIASAQVALQESCHKEDLDFASIINQQDELALLERKREQYQSILSEMFPDE